VLGTEDTGILLL